MERKFLKPEGNGRYFSSPTHVLCIPSGCRLLDRVLGGGWALGRIANLVGDKSSGKTLLAIEACANFARDYPKGLIHYRETEAAFDIDYAEAIGLPRTRVFLNPGAPVDTVEGFHNELKGFVKKVGNRGGLYVLDSLDALSNAAEMDAEFGKASFGGDKPKLMGQLFRRLVRDVEASNVAVIIVSQLRDKIGISFGERQTRSGGRALDFYASQIIWLAQLGRIELTRGKVKRPVGVRIRAKCKKNKIVLPFRECEFPILFGYGVDDFQAACDWLAEVGEEKRLPKPPRALLASLDHLDATGLADARRAVNAAVDAAWYAIERRFLPTRKKY